MTNRVAVIEAAKASVLKRVPDEWDGESLSQVQGSFRHFAEAVVGASAARILPALMLLEGNLRTAPSEHARIVDAGAGGTFLQVRDGSGQWFAARFDQVDEGFAEVSFYRPDPEAFGCPYPDLIASAEVDDLEGRPLARGSCELSRFGECVDALAAFADAAGVARGPALASRDTLLRYSRPCQDLLELDGGIAGQACREVAEAVAQTAAEKVMEWAAEMHPLVAGALEGQRCVWGQRMLRFNDLDNNVFVATQGDRKAIFHRNGSYISGYRTYVLVGGPDGLSLHALMDGTHAFGEAMAAFQAGLPVPFEVASIRDGKTVRSAAFDTTGVIDAMARGLKSTGEIFAGDRGDAGYNDDFTEATTMGLDDGFELDLDAGTRPRH